MQVEVYGISWQAPSASCRWTLDPKRALPAEVAEGTIRIHLLNNLTAGHEDVYSDKLFKDLLNVMAGLCDLTRGPLPLQVIMWQWKVEQI